MPKMPKMPKIKIIFMLGGEASFMGNCHVISYCLLAIGYWPLPIGSWLFL
jgi:hypothetical protein